MSNLPQSQHTTNWPRSGAKALLSAGGLAAITSLVTWFGTMSYERGQQSSQLHHLTVQLAKLENADAQRISMKERAEAAERDLNAAREQLARLRADHDSVQGRFAIAQASISKAERCNYLEALAKTSQNRYTVAANWAVNQTNGFRHPYYTEASANYERDRTNLTSCLTSSAN